jgi:hypothetical protein
MFLGWFSRGDKLVCILKSFDQILKTFLSTINRKTIRKG